MCLKMLEKRSMLGTEDSPAATQQKTTCALCPCPQLTAYWTPPPACPRRVCCETMSSFPLCGLNIFRDGKSACILVCSLLVVYYLVMDVFLYLRFVTVNIVEDSKPGQPNEMFSPFTHLSVKTIMNDHTSQYIINPSAEYFDVLTHFSTIFSFVTPNMISFTHLFLGLVSGKFVASENLYDRRVGVVIFEIRSWLDSLDGVVYRAQSGTHLQYQSVRATTGYYVDIICDALGGVFLCFGVLFYLWKRFEPYNQELPTWTKNQEMVVKSVIPISVQTPISRETYSKIYLFWKVFCYGLCLALAANFWDMVVANFKDLFQEPMKDQHMSMLQNELCHSNTTVILFYLWRLLEGQALLQYILVAIFIDKIWEFLNCTQYVLLFVIGVLYVVCLIYIYYLKSILSV